MTFFTLSWSWYEDYNPTTYYHNNKSNKDFVNDVKSLFIKYADEYLSRENSWIGANNWTEFVKNKLPELGYEKIHPFELDIFGAYIIKGDSEDDINFVKEYLTDDIFKRILEHNTKIEQSMYVKDENEVKK